MILRKKTSFFIVSRHRAKQNRRFGQKFSAWLSKLHIRGPKKHFGWTESLKKLAFTVTLRSCKKKMSAFWRKIFNRVFLKSHSTCPGKHFEDFFPGMLFLKLFWAWSEKNSDPVETFTAVLWILHSKCPGGPIVNIFQRNWTKCSKRVWSYFSGIIIASNQIIFFNPSSDIRRKILGRRRKLLSRFVKFAQHWTKTLRRFVKNAF